MADRVMRGLLVPVSTPFDPVTGEVAPVPLRAHARALLAAGAHGLVAAGSTGEGALLTEDEYRQVVEWLREVVPEDRLFVAGAGRESTRATVAAARVAAELGADAVLVRPPAYFGSSLGAPAMVDHFRRVAEGSPVPVLLYNIPKYTHVALTDQMLAALAAHPNIVGAKDSSGDLRNFAAYRAAAPAWTMLVGSGSVFYAALELGAAGGILAVANFATALALEVWRAFGDGDRARAGAAQERLTPVNKATVVERGVPGVKAAMDLVGRPGGPVRPPLADLGAGERERVAAVLRESGVLD
ncbi:MAG TPA: dihydrodipicolinate synthase family protein [Gemmatimonadales bacterium]|nr:dihydrodipicolinate synthase family protein [Gemmatimonadales bacterium]